MNHSQACTQHSAERRGAALLPNLRMLQPLHQFAQASRVEPVHFRRGDDLRLAAGIRDQFLAAAFMTRETEDS